MMSDRHVADRWTIPSITTPVINAFGVS